MVGVIFFKSSITWGDRLREKEEGSYYKTAQIYIFTCKYIYIQSSTGRRRTYSHTQTREGPSPAPPRYGHVFLAQHPMCPRPVHTIRRRRQGVKMIVMKVWWTFSGQQHLHIVILQQTRRTNITGADRRSMITNTAARNRDAKATGMRRILVQHPWVGSSTSIKAAELISSI